MICALSMKAQIHNHEHKGPKVKNLWKEYKVYPEQFKLRIDSLGYQKIIDGYAWTTEYKYKNPPGDNIDRGISKKSRCPCWIIDDNKKRILLKYVVDVIPN